MSKINNNSMAIACASGGFKAIFVHGVLSAFEEANLKADAYASTRMLHNYDVPAWINNQPYIDACYTCVCPALEMVEQGYQTVIAIATEAGNFYRDLFQSQVIPTQYQQIPIRIIQPDINPKDMGVDVFQATPE